MCRWLHLSAHTNVCRPNGKLWKSPPPSSSRAVLSKMPSAAVYEPLSSPLSLQVWHGKPRSMLNLLFWESCIYAQLASTCHGVIAMMLALAWDDRCSSTKLKLRPCPASSQSTTFIFSWTSYFSSLSWNCIRLQPISQQSCLKVTQHASSRQDPNSFRHQRLVPHSTVSLQPALDSVCVLDRWERNLRCGFCWAKRDIRKSRHKVSGIQGIERL
jgi:hypothetical protein